MDHHTFDQLARAVARPGPSRRGFLRGMFGLGAATLVGGRARPASAGVEKKPLCHFTGNLENPYAVITVAEPAWDTHFAHGDTPHVDCCVDADCGGVPCINGTCGEPGTCTTIADCPPSDACIAYSCDGGMCWGNERLCLHSGPGVPTCEVLSCDPEFGCVSTPVPAGEQGRCPDGSVCSGGGACVNLQTDPANCGVLGHACDAFDPCTPAACAGGVCNDATSCPEESTCLQARDCTDFTCADTPCTGTLCECPRVGPFVCDDGVTNVGKTINCDAGDPPPI